MSRFFTPARPKNASLCPIAGKWTVTKEQAKKEAKRLERQTGWKFNTWKCVCGGWHIGKRPRR